MTTVVEHLRRTLLVRDGAGLSDAQLLDAFVRQRDEAALAALMRRHGPMVWGVCRRILHGHHDAEDAFQATFLVFVRKAASIASRELLANWLYGVAHRAALKARHTASRRRQRERQVNTMPEPVAVEPNAWDEIQPILDQELSRLPEKYRIPILLCDLEGRTRNEAAQQLRVPPGTVASRLARAREMLAKRLARRGVGVAGAALAAVLAQSASATELPPAVVSATLDAARLFATGRGVSAKVALIADGVLKAMLLKKLTTPFLALLGVLLLCGIGLHMAPAARASRGVEKRDTSEVASMRDATASQAKKSPDTHAVDHLHLHLVALVKFHLVQLHNLVSAHVHGPEQPDEAKPADPEG